MGNDVRMALRVGTSGWHYNHWRGDFYPPGCPTAKWLAHYAGTFDTVEINASFYRLTPASTLRSWRDAVPDDFTFALKASRYLTHVRRLREPEAPVALLLERAVELGPKLGPLLLQLPPDMRVDVEALDRTLEAVGTAAAVAVEVRHPSWDHPEVRAVLEARGAALVLADRRGALEPQWRTTSWGYVRFHAGLGRSRPCYGRQALDTWVGRLRGCWPAGDVWAYFNNDQAGCAPEDAVRLRRRWALAEADPSEQGGARSEAWIAPADG